MRKYIAIISLIISMLCLGACDGPENKANESQVQEQNEMMEAGTNCSH